MDNPKKGKAPPVRCSEAKHVSREQSPSLCDGYMRQNHFEEFAMLTATQAAKIVRDCIKFVSGFDGDIDMGDKLQDVGIESANSQRSLKIEIATNPSIGVHSKGHTMSVDGFDFD